MRIDAILLAAFLASAADASAQLVPARMPVGAVGLVDIGVRATDVDGDAARFQRFRDVREGALLERFRWQPEGQTWLFRVDADERIVSVTRLAEVAEQNGNGAAEAPEGAATDAEEGDGPADE